MADIKLRPGIQPWIAELGEDLNAGDPVYVYDDGGAKVKKVYTDVGDYVKLDADGYEVANCTVDTNIVVTVWRNRMNSVLQAQVVNVETGAKGTMIAIGSGAVSAVDCCKLDTLKFAVVYRNNSRIRAAVGTVDASTLAIDSVGTIVALSTADGNYSRICPIDSTHFGCVWRHNVSPYGGYAIVSSVSGTTITPDAAGPVTFNYGSGIYYPLCGSKSGFFIICYRGAGYDLYAKVSTLTGTTLGGFPAGNGTLLHTGTVYPTDLFIINGKWICLFRDGSYNKAHVFMNMGPTISPGNTTQMSDGYSYYSAGVAVDDTHNKFIGIYTRDSNTYEGRYKIGYVPSDEISFGPHVRWWATRPYKIDVCGLVNDEEWEVAISMIEYTTYDMYVFKLGSGGNLFERCCGIVEQGGSAGDLRKIIPLGSITRSLTGTPGDTMYIQSDASISNLLSDFPIALMLDTDMALVTKDIG